MTGRFPSLDALAADRRTFLTVLAAGLVGVLGGAGCRATGGPAGAPITAGAPATGPTAAPTPSAPAFPRAPALPLPPVPAARPGPAQIVHRAPGGPGSTTDVALTIDDGYSPETVAGYVAFAERTGIPITFSPNGTYRHVWEPHAPRLRPLLEAGQVQISNHTYSHLDMLERGDATIRADIERNEEWIEQTFGITARPWFRPPFGRHSPRTDAVAGDLGYTRILTGGSRSGGWRGRARSARRSATPAPVGGLLR